MKNENQKLIFFLISFSLLILTGNYLWNIEASKFEGSRFERALLDLKQQPHPLKRQSGDPSLVAGSPERKLLFAVREAYDQLDVMASVNSDFYGHLEQLSLGLVSDDETVRETSGDIVRHVLTRWVRHRPQPGEFRSINVFFKFFAQSGSRSLRDFLRIYPNSPEALYLKQISNAVSV